MLGLVVAFNLDVRGAFFYTGYHFLPKPAIARYRDAVADGKRGGALERILARLAAEVADPGLTARLAAVALKARPLVDWLLEIAG